MWYIGSFFAFCQNIFNLCPTKPLFCKINSQGITYGIRYLAPVIKKVKVILLIGAGYIVKAGYYLFRRILSACLFAYKPYDNKCYKACKKVSPYPVFS